MSESQIRLEIVRRDLPLKRGQLKSVEWQVSQGPMLLGRNALADFQLDEESVSRRHAQVDFRGDRWWIRDVGSKVGTWVNGVVLGANEDHLLKSGDRIQLGPMQLEVSIKPDGTLLTADGGDSYVTSGEVDGTLATIDQGQLAGLPQHRLRVLLSCTETFSGASNERELADSVARAAAAGVGILRAVVLAVSGEEPWRVLGQYPAAEPGKAVELSRSLVKLATEGRIAKLEDRDADVQSAMSIQDLNIRSALAVPIQVDQQVEMVLYLDTRSNESKIRTDADSFCVGLAQLAGLTISKLRKEEFEKNERLLRKELEAARVAQRMLLPAAQGSSGPIQYATQSHPGTIVAGDLFDVVPLDDSTTLVFLGDVMGKGAPAGVMMATVQTYLRTRALEGEPLATLVESTNRFFYSCFRGKGFVTLWIAKFQTGNRHFEYVDAGHGHWLITGPKGIRQLENTAGGLFVGGLENETYQSGVELLATGERIILYTDGLVEQEGADHQYFGLAEITDSLKSSISAQDDVEQLISDHLAFRGEKALADDLTIASIELNS